MKGGGGMGWEEGLTRQWLNSVFMVVVVVQPAIWHAS